MLQTNPPFMAKLLEQLGGCAAISGGDSWELHRIRKEPLLAYDRAIHVAFRGLVGEDEPPPTLRVSFSDASSSKVPAAEDEPRLINRTAPWKIKSSR